MWPRHSSSIIIALAIFILCLPLVIQINFYQNDDWVYYRMVESFIGGNFKLDPISAPTFYFQGILGLLFALVFGTSRLPVLTLAISIINFVLFYLLIEKAFKVSNRLALLMSLLWFASPLNIYSSLGFMTENYLLFCLLASLYFFSRYLVTDRYSNFVVSNILLLLGLLTKQSALALALAYPFYFLASKRRKDLIVQFFISSCIAIFYFVFFPKTAEMYEKPLQFHHLLDMNYLKQLSKALLIYISAFCMPFTVSGLLHVLGKETSLKKLFVKIIGMILASFCFYLLFLRDFKPNLLAWQEFPYLDNTLERRGFYPRGVMGTKYHFAGIYDLYKYWDMLAKLMALPVIILILVRFLNYSKNTHHLIFFSAYSVLMLLAEKVYDRYLPPLFLAYILLCSEFYKGIEVRKVTHRLVYLLFVTFLAFNIFYSYQFGLDFVLVNRYIWTESQNLVETEKISPKLIKGTNAWKLSDYNSERNYLYDFTFDDVRVNKKYAEQYDLIKKHRVDFPGSIWVNPYVYLYKKRNFSM